MHKRWVKSSDDRWPPCETGEYGVDAAQSDSCLNCLPCGVTILSHVDAATDGAALNDSFESPRNRVSRNLHIAAKLDLVGVNYALQFCVVDLAVLHPVEFVAALLDCELLLTSAAWVLNRDGPRALDTGGSSRWN